MSTLDMHIWNGRCRRCRIAVPIIDADAALDIDDQRSAWRICTEPRAPAWHIEHFPASFWPRAARPGVVVIEDRVPAAAIAELKRRGHVVEVGDSWSEGRLSAASQVGARRRAAANPRGMQGYAAGR